MKVRLIDDVSPRSDGRTEPLGITVGKEYLVAEALHGSSQYSIINDNNKIARYSQNRFEVTDNQPIEPLRQAFNYLTMDMRNQLKALQRPVYPRGQVPASNMILTIAANADNEKLSDAEFREFVRNSLPICVEVIASAKEKNDV